MLIRLLLGVAVLLLLVAGNLPPPFSIMYPFTDGLLCRTAHAESGARNLLDRLLGRTMPEGIVKTNGRVGQRRLTLLRNIRADWPTSRLKKAARSRRSKSSAACRRRNTKRSYGPHNQMWTERN